MTQQETDPDSILNFYRKAIALRKELRVIRNGLYMEYGKFSSRFVYSRKNNTRTLLMVRSYSDKPQKFTPPAGLDLSTGTPVLSNHPSHEDNLLKPYETRVYLWKTDEV